MTENLAEMVKGHKDEEVEKAEVLDIEDTVEAEETTEKTITPTTSTTKSNDVDIVSLSEWFSNNHETFENINHVKVSIRGVDPQKTLIFSVPDATEENPEARKLQVVEEADSSPVPNIPGVELEVYNNGGFRIVHEAQNNKVIKCYGIKTGMIITHCEIIDGINIPIRIEKIKKRNSNGFNFISDVDTAAIEAKLSEGINLENIILQYIQIQKHASDLTTVKDVVEWMVERQSTITDINHHLKLDELMIRIIS